MSGHKPMTREDLRPCPACGAPVNITGGDEWHNQHEFWICCENKECGCVRVGDTEREECIRRWNDLPRALNWTTTIPSTPGWYLCVNRHWKKRMKLFNILKSKPFDNGENGHCFYYNNTGFDSDEKATYELDGDCMWAGPIPEHHWKKKYD